MSKYVVCFSVSVLERVRCQWNVLCLLYFLFIIGNEIMLELVMFPTVMNERWLLSNFIPYKDPKKANRVSRRNSVGNTGNRIGNNPTSVRARRLSHAERIRAEVLCSVQQISGNTRVQSKDGVKPGDLAILLTSSLTSTSAIRLCLVNCFWICNDEKRRHVFMIRLPVRHCVNEHEATQSIRNKVPSLFAGEQCCDVLRVVKKASNVTDGHVRNRVLPGSISVQLNEEPYFVAQVLFYTDGFVTSNVSNATMHGVYFVLLNVPDCMYGSVHIIRPFSALPPGILPYGALQLLEDNLYTMHRVFG